MYITKRTYGSPRFGIRHHVSTGLRGVPNPAVLGQQIVCEAKSWLGTVEVPAGSNKGGRVDDLLRAYFGEPIANPWCVVFVAVPVMAAIQKLGGASQFPTAAQVWGNAKKTLEVSRKVYRVDATPAIGAAFFRTSTTPGDGSSGHMGLVVGWDGTALLTIEGNQGNTNKVDVYRYAATSSPGTFMAGANAYPFEFIHVEETPISATATVPPCVAAPVVIPTTGTPTQPTQTPSTGTPTQPTQTPSTGTPTQPTQTPSAGTTSTVRRALPAQCKTLLVTIPSMEALPHWADTQRGLSNELVAADILGAKFKTSADYYRARNGMATRWKDSDGQDDHSGFGMFHDDLGNVIYITRDDNLQYEALRQYGLWGRGPGGVSAVPIILPIYRYFGSGAMERTAEVLQGKVNQNPDFESVFLKQFAGVSRVNSGAQIRWEGEGWSVEYNRPQDVLKKIAADGKRFDRPLLFLVYGEAVTARDVVGQVVQLTDMIVSVAAAFGPIIGLPDLSKHLQTYQTYRQAALTLANSPNVLSVLRDLVPIAQTVVPSDVRPYLAKGATVYDAVKSGNYVVAAKELGVDSLLMGQLDGVLKGAGGEISVVEKIIQSAKVGLNDARGTVQNLLNMSGIEKLARQVKSGSFFTSFSDDVSGMISKVPVLRDVLSSAGGDVLLSSIPRVTEVARAAIIEARDVAQGRLYREMKISDGDQDMLRGLILTGLGIPAPPGSLESLAYNAVAAKAEEAVVSGLKSFTLPPSIPPAKRECYAIKIREEKGITVLIEGQSRSGNIKVDTTAQTSYSVPMDFAPIAPVQAGETIKVSLNPATVQSTPLPPVVVQQPVKQLPTGSTIATVARPQSLPIMPAAQVLPSVPVVQPFVPQSPVVQPFVPQTPVVQPFVPQTPVVQPSVTVLPQLAPPLVLDPTTPTLPVKPPVVAVGTPTPTFPAPIVPAIAPTPTFPAPIVPVIAPTPTFPAPVVPVVAPTPQYVVGQQLTPISQHDDCGCGCGGTCGCDEEGLMDQPRKDFW